MEAEAEEERVTLAPKGEQRGRARRMRRGGSMLII
jgi:hypothetical protein